MKNINKKVENINFKTGARKSVAGFTPTPTLVLFRFAKIALLGSAAHVQKLISMRNDGETKKQHQIWCRGFTLVEMMVSLAIFTIILLIAMSAFLAIVDGDHKTRAFRIATDNLNLALEDMSRKIKTGSTYNCGGGLGVADCAATANSVFAFTEQDGVSRTIYKRGFGPGAIVNGASASGCGLPSFDAAQGCILREDSGLSILATSPEIDIKSLNFYVLGSAPAPDTNQPVVVVSIDGSLSTSTAAFVGDAGFKIQTTITQRGYDN